MSNKWWKSLENGTYIQYTSLSYDALLAIEMSVYEARKTDKAHQDAKKDSYGEPWPHLNMTQFMAEELYKQSNN